MPRKTSLKAKAVSDEPLTETKILLSKKTSLIVFLVLAILVLGGFFFKDKFVVAVVNGRPIFRYELDRELTSAYGKEVLENLLVEKLIGEEVNKNKVAVTEKEIDEEIAKLSQSLGEGVKIEEVLQAQGISLAKFRQQIKIRLQVNKVLEKEISVSDEEISQFIKDNEKSMTATGEAERKEEARKAIKDQKLGARIQTWIQELIGKAKISRFLK